jgi:hypothetical protein
VAVIEHNLEVIKTADWKTLQGALSDVSLGFDRENHLPLSVVLLTPMEWDELGDFFAPNRPLDWPSSAS